MKLSIELLLLPYSLIVQVHCWSSATQPDPTHKQERRSDFMKQLQQSTFHAANNFGKRASPTNTFDLTKAAEGRYYDRNADLATLLTPRETKRLPPFRKGSTFSRVQPALDTSYDREMALNGGNFRKPGDVMKLRDLYGDGDFAAETYGLEGNPGKLTDFRNLGARGAWAAANRQPYQHLMDVLRRTLDDYDLEEWAEDS